MFKKTRETKQGESKSTYMVGEDGAGETAARKEDHIALAFQSQVTNGDLDNRFLYEPLLAAHPQPLEPISFLGKQMKAPIWISSMTGGTDAAFQINQNLAKACKEFGLGMGLGSCRLPLDEDRNWQDFDLRSVIGEQSPFYANLGIAQIERYLNEGLINKVSELVKRLQADGLIIHVNPLQEWLQPEGDVINQPPIETIKRLLDQVDFNIIVKEVGQGMGPESLKKLMELPLAAVDFAAHGGTNFSKLEMLRNNEGQKKVYKDIAHVGHSAEEMVGFVNEIIQNGGTQVACKEVIVSGGVVNFLDGYYHINKINCNSIYGQGSALLKYANTSYEALQAYLNAQIKGLELATAYLKVKK